MGIPGLTTYVNRHSIQYYDNYQLENTLVVVDGNSLKYFIFDQCDDQTFHFGGDYDTLSKQFKDYFNVFIQCNVIPIVVLDGAKEERKINTILKRMTNDLQKYIDPFKFKCVPSFIHNIFIKILNDMDIPHVCCDFEADTQIVTLAKWLNCPILSSDSDFYLNLAPFIPFRMIDLNIKSTAKVINCKVFKIEKLLNKYGGLNPSYLPLISILLGNDYIKPDTFCRLLNLKPHTFDCELKLKKIIAWLKTQNSVNSAISNMTRDLRCKEYLLKEIKNFVQEYENMEVKYLLHILLNTRMSEYRDGFKHLVIKNETYIFPKWLMHNYRQGIVNSEIMTIFTLKKLFFKAQIEDYDEPPYYEISFKILERILGLLFGNNESAISCFGRKDRLNIGLSKIKPYVNNPYIPLADLNNTDVQYRKNIILNLIGVQNISDFPKDWELLILTLIYWAVNSNNHKSKHMHSLIVCFIILKIIKKSDINSQRQTTKSLTENCIKQHIIKVKKDDCIKANRVLSEYFQVQPCKNMKRFYKIIHPFVQFQCCNYYLMMLNSMMDFPFSECEVESYFKGSLLHNLCAKMENCDPKEFVSRKLFYKLDSLNNVYLSIVDHLERLMPVQRKFSNERIEFYKQTPITRYEYYVIEFLSFLFVIINIVLR